MNSAIAAFMLFGTVAQSPLGLAPAESSSPAIKLDGLAVGHVTGGYLVFSVPPKDIKRISVLAALWLHLPFLAVLDRLENETKNLAPLSSPAGVPLGTCFLSTDEILPRHKILSRMVQPVGTYTYINVRGRTVTVEAYAGGPTPH
jgi:hypothetical protein